MIFLSDYTIHVVDFPVSNLTLFWC